MACALSLLEFKQPHLNRHRAIELVTDFISVFVDICYDRPLETFMFRSVWVSGDVDGRYFKIRLPTGVLRQSYAAREKKKGPILTTGPGHTFSISSADL